MLRGLMLSIIVASLTNVALAQTSDVLTRRYRRRLRRLQSRCTQQFDAI